MCGIRCCGACCYFGDLMQTHVTKADILFAAFICAVVAVWIGVGG